MKKETKREPKGDRKEGKSVERREQRMGEMPFKKGKKK